ncbi:MAG: hypothetical protein A2Z27_06225 [candidate division Zixibacteria bacterium RBG_16_50_21]|nr:MAG: hypothetical protein A2Z27_06225 [candidate division Zixibacteria bacterium RBG_16_50_21]
MCYRGKWFGVLLLLTALNVCPLTYAVEEETNEFECGTIHPREEMRLWEEAIARGEIILVTPPKPGIPRIQPASHDSLTPKTPVTPKDFFLYEDTNRRLVNPFSFSSLRSLMVQAANALIARDGDQWDYLAYFCAFEPHAASQIGAAFYSGIKNSVTGLGDLGVFDAHASLSLSGSKSQGFVMMWNIASWDADSSDLANATHLVLGQEFEHRWGMFLFDTDNGVMLQGDDVSGCGRSSHWNWQVDLQGGGMESQEWTGSSPATVDSTLYTNIFADLAFNSDIGGVWSFTDLYLMGYVSPAEMDSGNSESRFMDDGCTDPYSGTITSFNSDNIANTNGFRSPDAGSSQHSFRTAWIVFYQPGDPPSTGELQRAGDMMTKWTQNWNFGTLGRGFDDNAILPPFVIEAESTSLQQTLGPNSPNFIPTGGGFLPNFDTVGFTVCVTDSAGTHDPTSGLLHYSVEGDTPYVAVPLASLGGGCYRATLPALACEQRINYYVSFLTSDSSYIITEPIGSSTTPFSAMAVLSESLILSDDFETDQGWTVGFTGDNATTGIWTRVDPYGTGPQPEHDNDTGSGTLCYVTGQGTPYPGGVLGENDVDGGRTSLISPAFDLSGQNGLVRYSRWYSNNSGATPGTDKFTITISNNNGTTFPETLEVVTENQIGWVTKQFVVDHFITPSSQMKVRFEASDLGAGTLVEAGVDDFEVFVMPTAALPGDANASGNYTLGDVIAIVNYLFNKPGCSPMPNCWLSNLLCRGDWDGSTTVTLGDVIRGVNYLFNKPGGPWNAIPVESCCKSL